MNGSRWSHEGARIRRRPPHCAVLLRAPPLTREIIIIPPGGIRRHSKNWDPLFSPLSFGRSVFQTLAEAAHATTRWEEVQVRASGMPDRASHSVRAEIARELGSRRYAVHQALQMLGLQLRGQNEDPASTVRGGDIFYGRRIFPRSVSRILIETPRSCSTRDATRRVIDAFAEAVN